MPSSSSDSTRSERSAILSIALRRISFCPVWCQLKLLFCSAFFTSILLPFSRSGPDKVRATHHLGKPCTSQQPPADTPQSALPQ